MILNLDSSSTRQPPHVIPDNYENESATELSCRPWTRLGKSIPRESCPTKYKGHLDSVLIPHSLILERTATLAQDIFQSYGPDKVIILLCVLKGASVFFHHLLNALSDLQQPYQYEFIRCSSYSGTSSTHRVHMENTEKLEALLPNRHVIVVEDIVDTGLTLKILLPQLQNTCHPQTLHVCTLLEKRVPRPPQKEGEEGGAVVAKYSGFSIPNKFIIGFGLDFNDLYRDLRDIWVISELGVALGGKI